LSSRSLEQGLALGFDYAVDRGSKERLRLGKIARARSADEVRANLDASDTPPAGLADPVAFWSGFAHGVARYLLEQGNDPVIDSPAQI
jgi:hypothetical protein